MLKGAFIGFGNVARFGHLPGWLARGDVEIVAAADVSPEGRALLAERIPDASWYDSAQAMLESERLDFVDVCTPPAFHAPAIRAALDRGLHVLCEKPLTLDARDLEELSALARANDRVLATVHNWRHSPVIARVNALVASGCCGPIRRVRWETLRDRPAAAAGAAARDNWRVDPAIAGGGILVDHGWHALYVVAAWLPGEPDRIDAVLETRQYRDWPIEDTATVLLQYPLARSEVFLTWTAAQRANRIEIEGSEATILVDGSNLEIRPRDGLPARREELPGSLAGGSHHPDWFAAVAEEFLAEIASPGRRGRSLAEARRCLRWIEAARESSRRGGVPSGADLPAGPSLGAAR